jgi:hypothetical protein
MCNVDLGLLAITDQESRNRPRPLANIRQTRRSLVYIQSIPQSSEIQTEELDVEFYSSEARTSINSSCLLCSAYSCATFEFLALDFTPLNN